MNKGVFHDKESFQPARRAQSYRLLLQLSSARKQKECPSQASFLFKACSTKNKYYSAVKCGIIKVSEKREKCRE
jgi:hypothetical protein